MSCVNNNLYNSTQSIFEVRLLFRVFISICQCLCTLWTDASGEDIDLSLSVSINKSKLSTVVSTCPTIPLIEPLSGPTICTPEIKTTRNQCVQKFKLE